MGDTRQVSHILLCFDTFYKTADQTIPIRASILKRNSDANKWVLITSNTQLSIKAQVFN